MCSELAQNRVNNDRVSWFVNEMVWEIVSPHFSRPCSICAAFPLPLQHMLVSTHGNTYVHLMHIPQSLKMCAQPCIHSRPHTQTHTHTMCASSRWMHACRHACKEASVFMFSDVGAFELVHCCVCLLWVLYICTLSPQLHGATSVKSFSMDNRSQPQPSQEINWSCNPHPSLHGSMHHLRAHLPNSKLFVSNYFTLLELILIWCSDCSSFGLKHWQTNP